MRGSRGVAVAVVAGVLWSAVPAGAVTTVTALHSYRAVYVVSDARRSTTYHFVVHSATDWEEWWSPASSPVTVVVGGTTYVRTPSRSTAVPASAWRVGSPARYSVSDPYPGLVSSARLVTWRQDSTCSSAGLPGTTWVAQSGWTGYAPLDMAMCVSRTHDILWWAEGFHGHPDFATGPVGARVFRVTQVGGVPTIAIP